MKEITNDPKFSFSDFTFSIHWSHFVVSYTRLLGVPYERLHWRNWMPHDRTSHGCSVVQCPASILFHIYFPLHMRISQWFYTESQSFTMCEQSYSHDIIQCFILYTFSNEKRSFFLHQIAIQYFYHPNIFPEFGKVDCSDQSSNSTTVHCLCFYS